ncbi:alr0857 family protein [Cyanothece sp. BG0011]|uniref:alr0857 family protein n=1 Tax=Cyanothece sp. BG0011 TaxID=2082950 RepID=UPI000D1DBB0B|nr:alr0857 family protein [Cyanothece sp. BG0011]
MLKLTYTHNGFYIDYLQESLETWVTTRVILALRSGTSLCVEPSSASFLISLDLPYVNQLLEDVNEFTGEIVEVNRCDEEAMEVVLEGTWLGSDIASEEGIFICRLSDRLESLLYQIWQESPVKIN